MFGGKNAQKKIEEAKQDTVTLRLNKYLSDAGVCSRREADRLIADGKVLVNGKTAEMGMRVTENDMIICNGKKVSLEEELILLAFNKPEGIECTTDKRNKDNIIDYIGYPKKITYIGRLDKNSCGLLLMTNDGDLANRIAKSVNHHEKEYIVRVNKKISEDFIRKMENGVKILDTITRKCVVKRVDDYTFRIVLTQGLNRQIRRMCEALSYKVVYLERVRVMNILLGNLKRGSYRNVTPKEMEELLKDIERK
ncbi:MAG: pseudouridine synthase [Lachnospiraceae bacterium]|nr:pseudouridine synthase [Lachnospiraceae bacterium]